MFYNGAGELPPSAIAHMEGTHNVKFVDVSAMPEASGVDLRGYQLKAFAILLSSFEEVLWLDSDNIPLVDPKFVFDVEMYVVQAIHLHSISLPDGKMYMYMTACMYRALILRAIICTHDALLMYFIVNATFPTSSKIVAVVT